ncbi:MAG TPA: hypothetical protein VGG74_36225 [Kofleriaceae bacterium]
MNAALNALSDSWPTVLATSAMRRSPPTSSSRATSTRQRVSYSSGVKPNELDLDRVVDFDAVVAVDDLRSATTSQIDAVRAASAAADE